MAEGDLRAKTSFAGAALVGGVSVDVDVAAGQVVRPDHPAVKGREQLFEPADDAMQRGDGAVRRGARRTGGE